MFIFSLLLLLLFIVVLFCVGANVALFSAGGAIVALLVFILFVTMGCSGVGGLSSPFTEITL